MKPIWSSSFFIASLLVTLANSSPIQFNDDSSTSSTPQYRRDFIRNMTLSAWNAYVQYGWGNGTIRPMSKSPAARNDKPARTIVASMSTLWTMELKAEFERAKQWVKDNLHYKDIEYYVSVPISVNDYMGSMLSCYALSGDVMFLDKAKEIGEALEPAYNVQTGLSMGRIKPRQKGVQVPNLFLSEIGGQHLEYRYLSDLTGLDPDWSKKIREFLVNEIWTKYTNGGIYLSYLDVTTQQWGGDQFTLQAFAAGFYSALIKSYRQSNRGDEQALRMYKKAIEAADQMGLIGTSRTGLLYIHDYYNRSGRFGDVMSFEGCYVGAMCALGARELQEVLDSNTSIDTEWRKKEQTRIDRHWELAKSIAETCYLATNRTKTGLPLEKFNFNANEDAENSAGSAYYYLRPQLAEAYLTLWRLTKDERYREYAWTMAQKIHQYARADESGGYTSILDVNSNPPELDDYQPPIFLSATLKYLYLTFAEETVLSFDKWVFNSAGHPLPICEKNTAYPKDKCTYG